MDEQRSLATDSPVTSAAALPGPHLLGRVYRADPRDWSLSHLLEIAAPPDSILQQTIEQVIAEETYFARWPAYLVLWRWLKLHQPSGPTPPPPPPPPPPEWALTVQLDQGQTNHCVGFGWSGWADAAPVQDHYQNADAHALYYEAKIIDGQPHGENGSTVRSGALAMRNRGRLAAFAFATSTDDIDSWIDSKGTVVVGTSWTNDMFDPDGNGLVKPTGPIAGGHCYVMIDKVESEDAYLFQNSWGSNWGLNGRFKIKRSDFASLLSDYGEACCAVELP